MNGTLSRAAVTCRTMSDTMYLVPVSGPPIKPLEIKPQVGGVTIGRHSNCDVLMPDNADRISRFHARLDCVNGDWSIVDLNSRWGTTVNGVRLTPHTSFPMVEGYLLLLSPYTFVFSSTPTRSGGVSASSDEGMTVVRAIATDKTTGVAGQMLQLLLEGSEQVSRATSEKMLADKLMDAALRGTGMTNAAFLRALDQNGRYEIIASRFTSHVSDESLRFSRSLIRTASAGVPAEISGTQQDYSQSIVQMNIGSAICVPLTIGSTDNDVTVAAYLYLDSRGMMAAPLGPQVRDFCIALGRMASLALTNLMRLDIERRQAGLESELKNAAYVQSWMLPRRNTTIGPLSCVGESRFGQGMGGDFFDLIDLGNNKVAVTIGDVSGKGVTASVLMTATQGYLHAALRASSDPQAAVTSAHAFIAPRRPVGKFITAWVGVIDLNAQVLRYVDAGHGYAVVQKPDGTCEHLECNGGGPPIGMIDDATYTAVEVPMAKGSSLLLLSDGIIEQFGHSKGADGGPKGEQFAIEGVLGCMKSNAAGADLVTCLFEALVKHAGSPTLSDDATIVWVKS